MRPWSTKSWGDGAPETDLVDCSASGMKPSCDWGAGAAAADTVVANEVGGAAAATDGGNCELNPGCCWGAGAAATDANDSRGRELKAGSCWGAAATAVDEVGHAATPGEVGSRDHELQLCVSLVGRKAREFHKGPRRFPQETPVCPNSCVSLLRPVTGTACWLSSRRLRVFRSSLAGLLGFAGPSGGSS